MDPRVNCVVDPPVDEDEIPWDFEAVYPESGDSCYDDE